MNTTAKKTSAAQMTTHYLMHIAYEAMRSRVEEFTVGGFGKTHFCVLTAPMRAALNAWLATADDVKLTATGPARVTLNETIEAITGDAIQMTVRGEKCYLVNVNLVSRMYLYLADAKPHQGAVKVSAQVVKALA